MKINFTKIMNKNENRYLDYKLSIDEKQYCSSIEGSSKIHYISQEQKNIEYLTNQNMRTILLMKEDNDL